MVEAVPSAARSPTLIARSGGHCGGGGSAWLEKQKKKHRTRGLPARERTIGRSTNPGDRSRNIVERTTSPRPRLLRRRGWPSRTKRRGEEKRWRKGRLATASWWTVGLSGTGCRRPPSLVVRALVGILGTDSWKGGKGNRRVSIVASKRFIFCGVRQREEGGK